MAAKSDNERLGFFSEPSYLSKGDPYKDAKPYGSKVSAKLKGKRQMIAPSTKPKNGTEDGYFTEKFDRVFAGEAYTDSAKIRRKSESKEKKKMLAGAFKPSAAPKSLASPGSYDGTFAGKIDYMSGKQKGATAYKSEKRNFTTFPAKKGTGYGYNDVTIGKPYEYKTSPYKNDEVQEKKRAKEARKRIVAGPFRLNAPTSGRVFTKNPYATVKPPGKKKLPKIEKKVTTPFVPTKPGLTMASGGKNFGTFTKLEYVSEKPKGSQKGKTNFKHGPFRPTSKSKTMVTHSIISQNARRSVNGTNFRTVKV